MRSPAPAVFVDTNVWLYGVDDHDQSKRDRAREWIAACWSRRCGHLSTQVLNEYYVNVRRKFPGERARLAAQAEIRRLQAWQPWVVDFATIEAAWRIESQFKFSHWDALMVASAQQLGCTALLTEDLQHGQDIDGLQIIDPFQTGPEWLDEAAPAAVSVPKRKPRK